MVQLGLIHVQLSLAAPLLFLVLLFILIDFTVLCGNFLWGEMNLLIEHYLWLGIFGVGCSGNLDKVDLILIT